MTRLNRGFHQAYRGLLIEYNETKRSLGSDVHLEDHRDSVREKTYKTSREHDLWWIFNL